MIINYDYLFKILIIGDSGVGKSSILSCYINNEFTESHISTIGVDFSITTIEIDNTVIKLQIWDTAGQERFRNITTSYYRGAQGIIVVYDITDRESYDNVKDWLSEIDRYCKYPNIIIVGNKSDIPNKRVVKYEEALDFANKNGINLVETSAKNKLNINKLFQSLTEDIKSKVISMRIKTDVENIIILDDNNNKNDRCC